MNFILQLDFDKGELRFLDPTTRRTDEWGSRFRMTFSRLGRPEVSGVLQDVTETSFTIDTGSAVNSLETSLFDSLIRDASLPVVQYVSWSDSGVAIGRCTRVPKLTLGSTEYSDIIFSEAHTSSLGMPFLFRHLVTLDFRHAKIYFLPGTHFQTISEYDMSGLYIRRIDGSIKVTFVIPQSPAEVAGIEQGDIIEEIEGIDALLYTVQEIRKLLRTGEGHGVPLKIRTGNGLVDTTIVLRSQI